MTDDPFWISRRDWKKYEAYIFGTLQRRFPGSTVTPNVRMTGLTGRAREVDVLVEHRLGDFDLKIAFDCKCYSRKVDVKHVESFLGMLDDIRVSKGVLLTTRGFTKTALERAHRNPRDVDLQILSPDRLSAYQHVGCAWLWKGPVAAIVEAPDGWVVDNEPSAAPGGFQFSMYALGHTRAFAMNHAAFLYGSIVLKSEWEPTMEAIASRHEHELIANSPGARFERLGSLDDGGSENPPQTLLRIARAPNLGGPEYSLYIDSPQGVLLLVLLCPSGTEKTYFPALKWIGAGAVMMTHTR
jgi:hypothetical protein